MSTGHAAAVRATPAAGVAPPAAPAAPPIVAALEVSLSDFVLAAPPACAALDSAAFVVSGAAPLASAYAVTSNAPFAAADEPVSPDSGSGTSVPASLSPTDSSLSSLSRTMPCSVCGVRIRCGWLYAVHLATHRDLFPKGIVQTEHESIEAARECLHALRWPWSRSQRQLDRETYLCACAVTPDSVEAAVKAKRRSASIPPRRPTGDSRDRVHTRAQSAGRRCGRAASSKTQLFCPAAARIVKIADGRFKLCAFNYHTHGWQHAGYDKQLVQEIRKELHMNPDLTATEVRLRIIASRVPGSDIPSRSQIHHAMLRVARAGPCEVESVAEGLLKLFADEQLAGVFFDYHPAGKPVKLDFTSCERLRGDDSVGAHRARDIHRAGLQLDASDQIVFIADDHSITLGRRARVIHTDAVYRLEVSSKSTVIIAVVSVDEDDVATVAALAVATSTKQAVLAHVLQRFNELVKTKYPEGITATTFAHDMVRNA